MELVIYEKDERYEVAKVLIKNGYKVCERKRKKTPTGKALEYYLVIEKDGDEVD